MSYVFVNDGDHTNYLIKQSDKAEFEEDLANMIAEEYTVLDCHNFDEKRGPNEINPDEIIINSYKLCTE